MEGYLKKWTNYVTRWKKRYFELHDGVLKYYKSKDGKLKGTLYLNTTKIVPNKNKCKIVLDNGLNTLSLKAPSIKEAEQWIKALKSEKNLIIEKTNDFEFQRIRAESVPDLIGVANYTKKLWSLHKLMEEKFVSFPNQFKEQAQEFMEYAQEFKNLAIDTLNLLEDERKKNIDDAFSDEGEFEDAKSHATEFLEEVKYKELQIAYRDKLPIGRNPNQKFNIWKILKDTIGKDMSKMAVPVYFNEPLSFLQRFTEDLTYNNILVRASETSDSCLRLALVCCFAISSYASSGIRLMKPFNPVLGETFELERDGFRVISEQVSHHPPVSAIHAEHPEYTFYASTSLSTSFKGTYLKLRPKGKCHVLLHKFNDHYVWEKPYTNVNNIIVGKINVDHHGKIDIKNVNTNEVATVVLKKKGWFSKEAHSVMGSVCDSIGNIKYSLEGYWDSEMKITSQDTGKEIIGYNVYTALPDYELYYYFTEFAMQLNLPPELLGNIAPTDSRYRPDQRALENAQLDLAASEKVRVEEKQRHMRKEREQSGIEYKPMWFYINPEGEWAYKGGYWQAKQYENFSDCPDIF